MPAHIDIEIEILCVPYAQVAKRVQFGLTRLRVNPIYIYTHGYMYTIYIYIHIYIYIYIYICASGDGRTVGMGDRRPRFEDCRNL